MLKKIILASMFCFALCGASYGQKDKPNDKEKPKPECKPDFCRPEPKCPLDKVPIDKTKPDKNPKEKSGKTLVEVKTRLPIREC
jgi:hypothetical protein